MEKHLIMKKIRSLFLSSCILLLYNYTSVIAQAKPDTLSFKPFVWQSEAPSDCPFKQSKELNGIKFLGLKSGLHGGDTWYPTWAADDNLYSPYTDGGCSRLDGGRDHSSSWDLGGEAATTAQAVMEGNDPLTLKVYSLGKNRASSLPYRGRYPCGSLIHNGVWYYGTYCLDPGPYAKYGDIQYNWPWLGPFVGFRTSKDYGRAWEKTPHTPEKPIFGETGKHGHPVKIGSPHFVDFGKNMQHSPDGKAYLVAHGAEINDSPYRFHNQSWITGDQVYLIRVEPSIENINDASQYEFYAGKDKQGNAIWSNDFKNIKPLLEWDNNMGCVTMTYNAPLKKYLMCVTDGGNTAARMNTYILESDSMTGDWKLVTYMKDFGEQAYFVNIPSKFISSDGEIMWLMYSGNFAPDWNNEKLEFNPPGSHYGMVMQKVELLSK